MAPTAAAPYAVLVTPLPNPLFGPNRFKLGIFSANCDGGLTMSLAPERWKADWDDIVAMTRIADDAGLEFILPVAKWRGYQGKANIYGRSFETLTHGAALGAVTQRIAIFSTVHVPLVTPAFAAKAIATIDHVTHGRAGLNIVCGWNQAEFDLHGVTIDPDTRYDHGLEWFQIWAEAAGRRPRVRLGRPLLQTEAAANRPGLAPAPPPAGDVGGFSPPDAILRRRAADVLFLNVTELDQVPALLADVAAHMARHQPHHRRLHHGAMSSAGPPGNRPRIIFITSPKRWRTRPARPTTAQNRGATVPGAAGPIARPFENRFTRAGDKRYAGGYPGAYPFVGSPDDIATEMAA